MARRWHATSAEDDGGEKNDDYNSDSADADADEQIIS